ncbi:hypothetical protein ACFL2V_01805, partial [Pseudomonadota bacterium]
ELAAASLDSALVLANDKISSLESQLSQSESCISMLEEELDTMRDPMEHGGIQEGSTTTEPEAGDALSMPPNDESISESLDEKGNEKEIELPDDVLTLSPETKPQEVPGVVAESEVEESISIEAFKVAADTSEDLSMLASTLIDAVAGIGLSASLKIQGLNELVTKSTEGEVWPDDLAKMSGDLAVGGGQDGDPELLISFGSLALLIKDMPLYDLIRCEEIKNNIAEAVQIAAEMAEMIDSYGMVNNT